MCGRYGLTISEEELEAMFGAPCRIPGWVPRYNIAPTQSVPVLVQGADGPEIVLFRWGLVPSWADDPAIGNRLINARSETVGTKPSFRGPWKRNQRCAILANGFYEWQAPSSGKGPKTPYWIHRKDRAPFAFAGIWERWEGGDAPLLTTTILTRGAGDFLRPIHDRMPVILGSSAEWESWIRPDESQDRVRQILDGVRDDPLATYPVSTYVNRPGNEGPECMEPVGEG